MNNLHSLYVYQNRLEEAGQLQRRVDKYRRKNPYYLLMLGDEALAQSRYEDAASLLRQAIRLKETEHRLHFALARTLYLSGDRAAAEASLRRARELAPADVVVDYSAPLEQLVDRN